MLRFNNIHPGRGEMHGLEHCPGGRSIVVVAGALLWWPEHCRGSGIIAVVAGALSWWPNHCRGGRSIVMVAVPTAVHT